MNERDIDVRDGARHRAWLASLIQHGVKLGLRNIRALTARLDYPHRQLRCVHVAGTNGKGSTCAFLDTMFQAAGLRVGRYTSPHIHDVTERIQINGVPIPETAFSETMERVRAAADHLPHPPTFFEALTAAAFDWFAREKVDLAVIETGLGGRFDATSVMEHPVLSIITGIALEHTRHLGTTLQAIAMEKAGILRAEIPCLVGDCPVEAASVIEARAAAVGSPLSLVGRDIHVAPEGNFWHPAARVWIDGHEYQSPPLPLPGIHQAWNAGLAISAAHRLRRALGISVSPERLIEALAHTRWPGRLEKVWDDPPVYLDAAHNPQGIGAILPALENSIVVISVAADKDARAMAALIESVPCEVVVTAFQGSRAMPAEQLADYFTRPLSGIFPQMRAALGHSMGLARSRSCRLVALGSIYAIAEVRTLLAANGPGGSGSA